VENNVLIFGVQAKNVNFATIIFSKNLSARIILVLNSTFAPHLTFLGLLSPEISFGDTQFISPSVNFSAEH